MTTKAEINPFETAVKQINAACDRLNIDGRCRCRLVKCQRELTANFPVRMDDGTVQVFTGFRVQHNDSRGPAKGGIRYHPRVTLDETRALAVWMTLKAAVANIPYGGAKGAVQCDPKVLSKAELERLTRRYAAEISIIIGPESDIPAPDIGTNPQIMAWIADAYSMGKGYYVPAVVTGKPVEIGGTRGRFEATGRGCMIVTRLAAKEWGMNLEGASIAVQGIGNVAAGAAKLLAREKCRIVAMSDSRGGVYNPNGLDIAALISYKEKTGTLAGFKEGEAITNRELLALPCEVLVPAAIEDQITAENAGNVKARFIVEGANGPTTPEADDILWDKGIIVIPDVLANIGGVVVSYFEWVQNIQALFWTEEEVNRELETLMTNAFGEVLKTSKTEKVSLRTAAHMLAVGRIAKAMLLRGVSP